MEPNKWETNVKKTSNITLDKWQVNRLFKIQNIFKTGAFSFGFETPLPSSVSPHSSCLSHLTLLVCLTSLFLSVSPHSSCLSHLTLLVCLTSLFLSVSSTHSPHVINEIWSVMRDCCSFGALHWAATFSFNCSVCSLTDTTLSYCGLHIAII